MKKILLALCGVMLLAGCANTQEETNPDTSAEVIKENEALAGFPEYDILAEHIDLNMYVADIETDNKGSRVIFYENEQGEKEYKSIFIKNENRLKIISLDDDDGMIYNDQIS